MSSQRISSSGRGRRKHKNKKNNRTRRRRRRRKEQEKEKKNKKKRRRMRSTIFIPELKLWVGGIGIRLLAISNFLKLTYDGEWPILSFVVSSSH